MGSACALLINACAFLHAKTKFYHIITVFYGNQNINKSFPPAYLYHKQAKYLQTFSKKYTLMVLSVSDSEHEHLWV